MRTKVTIAISLLALIIVLSAGITFRRNSTPITLTETDHAMQFAGRKVTLRGVVTSTPEGIAVVTTAGDIVYVSNVPAEDAGKHVTVTGYIHTEKTDAVTPDATFSRLVLTRTTTR